jgi:hypothetical protein
MQVVAVEGEVVVAVVVVEEAAMAVTDGADTDEDDKDCSDDKKGVDSTCESNNSESSDCDENVVEFFWQGE